MNVEIVGERIHYERGNNFLRNTFQNYSYNNIFNYVGNHPELLDYPDKVKKKIFNQLYEESLEKFLKRFEK